MKSIKDTNIALVVGLPGSQKTTLCNILVAKGFRYISMSSIIYDHMENNNIDLTLSNLIGASVELRNKNGEEYLVKQCLSMIYNEKKERIVIDGARTPLELKLFKEKFKNAITIAIHSSCKGRHEYMFQHPDSLVKTNKEAEMLDSYELKLGAGETILFADHFIVHKGLIDRTNEITELANEISL